MKKLFLLLFLFVNSVWALELPAVQGRLLNQTRSSLSLRLKLVFVEISDGGGGSSPGTVLHQALVPIASNGSYVVPAMNFPASRRSALLLRLVGPDGEELRSAGLLSNTSFGTSLPLTSKDEYANFLTLLGVENWTEKTGLTVRTPDGSSFESYVERLLRLRAPEYLSPEYEWNINVSSSLQHLRSTGDPRRNRNVYVVMAHARTSGADGLRSCSGYDACLVSSAEPVNNHKSSVRIHNVLSDDRRPLFVVTPQNYYGFPGEYSYFGNVQLRIKKRGVRGPLVKSFELLWDRTPPPYWEIARSLRGADIVRPQEMELLPPERVLP